MNQAYQTVVFLKMVKGKKMIITLDLSTEEIKILKQSLQKTILVYTPSPMVKMFVPNVVEEQVDENIIKLATRVLEAIDKALIQ